MSGPPMNETEKIETWLSTSGERRAWVQCGCGKERQLKVPKWAKEGLVQDYIRLFGTGGYCQACLAKYHMESDSCPETYVSTTGGVSSCRLGFEHVGRCVP